MSSHLSQIVAVEKDIKEKAAQALDHARRQFKNDDVLFGISKVYTPNDDAGERVPPESKRVQVKVKDELTSLQSRLEDLFNITATKDYANCTAKADIIVDGKTLLPAVPTTYLLFLEKQLAELATFVKAIPTLDTAQKWDYDKQEDCYASAPIETYRTKKDKKSQTVFPGNEHHPPQFLVWDEDSIQGTYRTVKYSGGIPLKEVHAISSRLERLQRAVKFAREEANRLEVKQQEVGEPLLHYIFQ